MKPILQDNPAKAAITVMPRRWWVGAARILGISPTADRAETGHGFDFAGLHRSLEGLNRKPPSGE